MNIQQLIGPDELASMIGRPLPVIFEKSWQLGNVLSKWKVANVTYIFKKKKKGKADKYSDEGNKLESS